MADTARDIEPAVPVLWLLGKTGAGKTSLVRALTGEGVVGSGFAPGTRQAQRVDFPADAPAVRFLDTRGLGEAGYDPATDMAAAQAGTQAVLAVVRLDDPVQEPVAAAIRQVKLPVLLVFTGADLMASEAEQERARARFRALVGRDLPFVTLAMPADGLVTGIEALLDALDSFMPRAAASLRRADEARAFAAVRKTVLRYAAAAGASDIVPLAGVATVPAAQGAMLQALAKHHGVALTPARLGLLASALGTGALVRMGIGHVLRQGAKLVPFAGQTLGAAAAAGTSFATTWALGRAASAWLYGVARGAPPDPVALRALYDQALRGARNGPG
ncbi:MAG: GTPase domain-containing protein [Rhodobacter sp.]|nr:GTPase domain-containing protein [Paracoccaceae bacterium]MCC0077427.1 GTPase domain-containing protein [Rhodobacter sp.]